MDGNFTQMEANFSLFWGLAIQLYEATLVADNTAFDRFAAGRNNALTEEAKLGLEMFLTKGRCINCHAGPEFTGASVRLRACPPFGDSEAIERMLMGNGNPAVYDGGFYNIGVRPTLEDLAVGADLAGFRAALACPDPAGDGAIYVVGAMADRWLLARVEQGRLARVEELADPGGDPFAVFLGDPAGGIQYLVDPGVNGRLNQQDDGTPVQKYDAPKAALMSFIIDGTLSRDLPMSLILLGVAMGLTSYLVDAEIPAAVLAWTLRSQ